MTRSSELSTTVQCASFLKSELCDSDVDVGGTCKVRHWKDIYSHSAGRLIACRPPGAPAGHWPHTPWWHCVLHDPYERVNFWSHAVPGVAFLLLGLSALSHLVAGGPPLFIYSCCASITHLFSALTHVYPDSHSLVMLGIECIPYQHFDVFLLQWCFWQAHWNNPQLSSCWRRYTQVLSELVACAHMIRAHHLKGPT